MRENYVERATWDASGVMLTCELGEVPTQPSSDYETAPKEAEKYEVMRPHIRHGSKLVRVTKVGGDA